MNTADDRAIAALRREDRAQYPSGPTRSFSKFPTPPGKPCPRSAEKRDAKIARARTILATHDYPESHRRLPALVARRRKAWAACVAAGISPYYIALAVGVHHTTVYYGLRACKGH